MLRRLTLTFEASTKRRIYLRRRKVIGFVFHSAGTILEIDGSEVSDGEIEILPPPCSRSPCQEYIPAESWKPFRAGSIEINETKIRKRKTRVYLTGSRSKTGEGSHLDRLHVTLILFSKINFRKFRSNAKSTSIAGEI